MAGHVSRQHILIVHVTHFTLYSYGKKAIFKNTPQPSRSIPHFNNVDSLKLKRNMKICAHCHEKKETSLDNHTTTFYCKTCLAEKLTWYIT